MYTTHVTCNQSLNVQGKYLYMKYFVQLSVWLSICLYLFYYICITCTCYHLLEQVFYNCVIFVILNKRKRRKKEKKKEKKSTRRETWTRLLKPENTQHSHTRSYSLWPRCCMPEPHNAWSCLSHFSFLRQYLRTLWTFLRTSREFSRRQARKRHSSCTDTVHYAGFSPSRKPQILARK